MYVLSSKFKIHLGIVRSESRARLGAKSWAPQHQQDASNLNNTRYRHLGEARAKAP
jgi:hypothetical protein